MKRFLIGLFVLAMAVCMASPGLAVVAATQDVTLTAEVQALYSMTVDPVALDFGAFDPGTSGPTIGWRPTTASVECSGSTFMLRVTYSGLLSDGAGHTLGYAATKPVGGIGGTTPDPNAPWATGTTLSGACAGYGIPVATAINFGMENVPTSAFAGNYTGSATITLEY